MPNLTPKPSELQEEQWIKIQINTGYREEASPGHRPRQTGAIGFHVYYSQLSCFAINYNQKPNDPEIGLLITDNPNACDEIYEQWLGKPSVIITHSPHH
ncbi:hypothetical protein N9045_01815 [bacterium]|nr:hypothetical protein [bacterium]